MFGLGVEVCRVDGGTAEAGRFLLAESVGMVVCHCSFGAAVLGTGSIGKVVPSIFRSGTVPCSTLLMVAWMLSGRGAIILEVDDSGTVLGKVVVVLCARRGGKVQGKS